MPVRSASVLTEQAKPNPATFGLVRIRHKAPDGDEATENTWRRPRRSTRDRWTFASPTGWRRSPTCCADAQKWSLEQIAATAKATAGTDRDRLELGLIEKAARLRGTPVARVAN